ncbi:killer cell lectin-like receptor subfamily B member 1B allele B [Aquarana catesbeiana]|uniref:killer cell lectin-like receptor subfamily B member 1B allele B n=1 Tax=Aquarana catesbeiana TaxID=8400 RepID=UPI003CCA461A
METTDNSGRKLWRPSWKGVIITLLVGSNIILIRIIEALDQQLVHLKKQLCMDTSEELGCALCPYGWLWDRENCYYISSGRKYRTWNESREVCEEMGADLLVIEDREQQEFIHRSINQQTNEFDFDELEFWIGLYRDGDGWRWVDGRLYNISQFRISEEYSGDCVWWGANSEYNRDRCQSPHNWICQKRVLKI